MAGTGLATANLAGLNRSVFQGTREPLSPSFAVYPTFAAHFYLALLLLAGFIVLHVLAAPYHHFARMDRCRGGCGSGGGFPVPRIGELTRQFSPKTPR
jgi:cytochrome b561